MESNADTCEKRSPTDLNYPDHNNNNKHNLLVFYEIKKYNEIELTKRKMDLNNRKMKNPPNPTSSNQIGKNRSENVNKTD